jgi:hypothetical protein
VQFGIMSTSPGSSPPSDASPSPPTSTTALLPRLFPGTRRKPINFKALLQRRVVFGAFAIMVPAIVLITCLSVLLPQRSSAQSQRTVSRGSGDFDPIISHLSATFSLTKDRRDEAHPDRKLAVTMFFPEQKDRCKRHCSVPYMPDRTAKVTNAQFFGDENAGVFDKIEYNACCEVNHDLDLSNVIPVVMTPQVGSSRFLYGGIAQDIVSHGFAVLLIDHPHDGSIVEWNDGKENCTFMSKLDLNPFGLVETWNQTIDDAIDTQEINIRAVVDRLSDSAFVGQLFGPSFKVNGAFNTDKVGLVGHGIGGTTVTKMSASDAESFPISVNMAGSPPEITEDVHSDVVFLGRQEHRRENDIYWPAVWPRIRGKANEWTMARAGLFDYSDVPKIIDIVQRQGDVKGLGTLRRREAFEIAAQWPRAHLGLHFYGLRRAQELVDLANSYMGVDMKPYPGA